MICESCKADILPGAIHANIINGDRVIFMCLHCWERQVKKINEGQRDG